MKSIAESENSTLKPWQQAIHTVIFEAETKSGRLFDIFLLWAILLSIVAVLLESVESIRLEYGSEIRMIEWGFTLIFTVEYVLRIVSVVRPRAFIFSFWGVVDLLAILPSYMSIFISGSHFLLIIRCLRLLRIFRVFRLSRYLGEARVLRKAVMASTPKIIVFFGVIVSVVLIMGTLMFIVEGPENGYTSIPRSIYWAIVTLTTVGYGDIAPQTVLGQSLASLLMILGYAIIAVPTGIVTAELTMAQKFHDNTETCPSCMRTGHDRDAKFCRICGGSL